MTELTETPTEVITPRLELIGITRRFPGVLANNNVNLKVMPGEIHALLGENGAGKSTLVRFIYGVQKADSGKVFWQGRECTIPSPRIARQMGIGMVFQHFSLFDAMTVEENIALGVEPELAKDNLADKIQRVSAQYGLLLDPGRYVHTLSVGERQRIEIVRCLLQKPKLLIMDEPTSVLTPQEVEDLFKTLRRLSGEGCSILYISHKLQEIKELCHTATIMRMGEVVDDCIPSEETARSMAEMMMGKNLLSPVRANRHEIGAPQLSVHGLSVKSPHHHGTDLKDINFEVRSGEILGIAGIAGNGQRELMEVLSGEVPVGNADAVVMNKKSVGQFGPKQRRKAGMGYVPEERLGHGAVADMSLWENAFLSAATGKNLLNKGFILIDRSTEFAVSVVNGFRVKTPGVKHAASSLSGGNLQKFIIGRELLQDPNIIVVLQPTWGVDAGSAAAIRQALLDRAADGAAVLVISQDLEELFEVSDRIAVISGGRLSESQPTESLTVDDVGLMMAGLSHRGADPEPAPGTGEVEGPRVN
ncbi:MAG: ABC transporter ATP-binding protein [Rhodospirillales bacterium]|nr:ABC transporter ATP-binding protein [Rhodospirillales bacterium]